MLPGHNRMTGGTDSTRLPCGRNGIRQRSITRDRRGGKPDRRPAFRQTGYLQLASRAASISRCYAGATTFREIPGARQIQPIAEAKCAPTSRMADVMATSSEGLYTAVDGRANPVDITSPLRIGARPRAGVTIRRVRLPAESIRHREGRPLRNAGVTTCGTGRIEADTVVLATGMWTRQIGARIKVQVSHFKPRSITIF